MPVLKTLSLWLAFGALVSPSALAQAFEVAPDSTVPLRLKTPAASVIIGNPDIADITVHDERLILVTGRTLGATNLLILDGAGRQIYANDVVVKRNDANALRVNRGGTAINYDCAPNCLAVNGTASAASASAAATPAPIAPATPTTP